MNQLENALNLSTILNLPRPVKMNYANMLSTGHDHGQQDFKVEISICHGTRSCDTLPCGYMVVAPHTDGWPAAAQQLVVWPSPDP